MVQAVEPSETRHHTSAPLSSWSEGQRAARYEALLRASQAISAQRDPKAFAPFPPGGGRGHVKLCPLRRHSRGERLGWGEKQGEGKD